MDCTPQAKADAVGGTGRRKGIDIFFVNKDAQDSLDESLLHRELTGEMIQCGAAGARD